MQVTLFIAYANRRFAALAADRRITRQGMNSPVDDRRTKTLIYRGTVIVAFTGLAELGRRRQHTMEWLAALLAEETSFDTAVIADAAMAELARTSARRQDKRLAFGFVGFSDSRPVFGIVSNMHSEEGEVLNTSRDQFVQGHWLPVQPDVRAMPRIDPSVNRAMLERMRSAHREGLPSEGSVSAILAGAIQGAAGPTIGTISLITILRTDGHSTFNVVTPRARPGQISDLASPYCVGPGVVMVMPSQPLRRSARRRV